MEITTSITKEILICRKETECEIKSMEKKKIRQKKKQTIEFICKSKYNWFVTCLFDYIGCKAFQKTRIFTFSHTKFIENNI